VNMNTAQSVSATHLYPRIALKVERVRAGRVRDTWVLIHRPVEVPVHLSDGDVARRRVRVNVGLVKNKADDWIVCTAATR
jgi:hypothetical protein